MYDLETTDSFAEWFNGLPSTVAFRLTARFERVRNGLFGDAKNLGDGVSELRFFFGSGYRVYYTIRDNKIVLLLAGGDKASQVRDIKQAKALLADLE